MYIYERISNRKKRCRKKIKEFKLVLLYTHCFYILMIQYNTYHVAYKNVISNCLRHIILSAVSLLQCVRDCKMYLSGINILCTF